MKTRHILPALLSAACLTPLSALDLTAPSRSKVPAFRMLEGVRIPIVVFPDGDRKVEWQPPADWELRGDATLLTLRPPGASKPAMELRQIPIADARAPQSDAASEDLIEWARSFLPADATKIAFLRDIPSPFLLGGLPSREVTFSYLSLAQYCTTSIALVDLDDELSMAIVICARNAEFSAIRSAGIESLFRWNWIGPTPDRVAKVPSGAIDPAGSSFASREPSRARAKRGQ